jgi:anti-sigma factor RsiW
MAGGPLEKRLHGLGDDISNGDAVASRGLSLRKAQDMLEGSGNVSVVLYRWLTATCHSGVYWLRRARAGNLRSDIDHGSPIPDYRGKSGRFPKYDWPQILHEVENLYGKEPWPDSYTAAARHIVAWLQELHVDPPDENYLRLRISQHMHAQQHPTALATFRGADAQPATSHSPGTAPSALRRVIKLSVASALVLLAGIAGYNLGINDARHQHVVEEIVGYFMVHAEDPLRIIEISSDDRRQIEIWFGRRIGTQVRVPDLSRFGLTFRGGRLMVVGTLPTPMLVYETVDELLVGLCMVNMESDHPDGVHSKHAPNVNGYFWSRRGILFVLVGGIDTDYLRAIAHDVETQFAITEGTVVR